nr:septin-4-like [Oncorhynchus nerka]
MAECTVAPVAMEDSDCEAHSSSDDQDSAPPSPGHTRDHHHQTEQHSSHSKDDSEDSELENIMQQDPHHNGGHPHPHLPLPSYEHSPDHEHPHPVDREAEGGDSPPNTPGTPTSGTPPFLRPPTAGGRAQSDNQCVGRLQLGGGGLVDHYDMQSPLSPTRPKSPWGRFDPYDFPEDQDKEYVGFATLPNQVHRKSVKKGFDFTLMVAGESGLGKSTLVNSLFLTDLYKDRKLLNAEERITQTVEITKHTVDIEEKGVKLKLTIVDTPGFGDAVNNTECVKREVTEVSGRDYMNRSLSVLQGREWTEQKNIQDNRVHCCLYFISPFGHGLRPLDVEFMKALHEKVNIVPILAKADTLTPTEVKKKKFKIREEIQQYGIKIYQFPDCDSDEDEDFKQQDQELKDTHAGPEGVTRETHYENYRAHCIQSMTRMVVKERNRNKLTRESGTDFPIPVIPSTTDTETEKLIREKDEELRRMQEMLTKIQEQMHTQKEAY